MNREDVITSWFAEQSALSSEMFPIGIGDDMAQVRLGGDASVLITADMLLDGSHFDLATCTLEQVGYKAMAASLSDCAAMATVPLCAVGASALPVAFGHEELKQLHNGVQRAAEAFNCPVVGGDITKWTQSSDRFAVNITMLSRPSGHHVPVRRSGAQPGDVICVTGTLGGSLAGKHLTFIPRVNEALEMTRMAALNAMMDLTDGLSTDLARMCRQSGVGAELDAVMLPLSQAAKQSDDPIAAALNDGEDFELLFTLRADEYEKLKAYEGVMITPVGVITGDVEQLQIKTPNGQTRHLTPGGFDHL